MWKHQNPSQKHIDQHHEICMEEVDTECLHYISEDVGHFLCDDNVYPQVTDVMYFSRTDRQQNLLSATWNKNNIENPSAPKYNQFE